MRGLRSILGRGVLALAAAASVGAQEILVEEDFGTDPAERWSLNARDATLPFWDQGQARVVLTGTDSFEGGALILREPIAVDDLRLEARVKLCCGSGADGLAFSFFEGIDPSVIGEAGGGLCATGLTAGPHLLLELDLWNNAASCEACPNDIGNEFAGNHVLVAYSPMGFPAGDCLPGSAAVYTACAGTGELGFDLYGDCIIDVVFELTNGGYVTVDVGVEECGTALHRVIETELSDFVPFNGLLGVTAATGGYSAEHSIYGLRLGRAGDEGCREPPVVVRRDITAYGSLLVDGIPQEAYEEGGDLDVVLHLEDVRVAGGECTAAGDVTITEELPASWMASNVTGGGELAEGKIVWRLRAGDLAGIQELAYTARGPATLPVLTIRGTVSEDATGVRTGARGEQTFRAATRQTADGFITSWLLLGAYTQDGGAAPPAEAMRLDYLTDGAQIAEASVMPRAGDTVATEFNGAAAATGLAPSTGGGLNPDGIPQWYAWEDSQAVIRLASPELYGNAYNTMGYGVCYLEVEYDIEVAVACGSDDAIQILVDDVEVWINPVARMWSGGATPDLTAPFVLGAGVHRLMVKVFQGGGEWNFGVRLQDATGAAPLEGLRVRLEPDGPVTPPPVTFKRGDTNADGAVNIADAVFVLGHLFSMKPPPTCALTADANDDGIINIADSVTILGHLFARRGPLPEPFEACGTDATPGNLTCVSFAPCAGH